MRRRRLLAGIGAACLGAVSGCSGQSDGPTVTGTATSTSTATETPFPPTATATSTPTATATGTPTPTPVVHSLGERFVVDEGDDPFAYTVHGFRRTDRLLTTPAAEGTTFLIVACTVENLQRESKSLPSADIWLRSADVRKNVSVSATNTAGSDSHIREESLTDGPIPAETSERGIVVFSNAPLGPTDYRLLFTPPSTIGPITDDPTRTHQVAVGSLGDVERIE